MENLDLDFDFDPADEEFEQAVDKEALTRNISLAMEELKKITPEFNRLRKEKETLEDLIKSNFSELKMDRLQTPNGNVEKQVKVSEVISLKKLLAKIGQVKSGQVILNVPDIELLGELVNTVKGKIEKALPKDQVKELIIQQVGDPTYKINLDK